ncbi:MAG: transposase family protein [Proteobacteria bacterium]|nr:transposase family protein [Pseudomonadota bacterium]
MLVLVLWLWLFLAFLPRPRNASRGRRFVPAVLPCLRSRKPEWVLEEVIRLKALMAEAGCRRIADTFNRLHAARHRTTVSKTWVAVTVRRHRLEIAERRREWKRRIPSPMPANRLWGIDLTGKRDFAGVIHPILGIVDHGSRLSVSLRALPDKATIAILRALLDAIEQFGKPRAVRTDNEAIFTSRLFRLALWTLGIRHQRTDPHCPWQNGRVERFFGTLKEKLDCWQADGLDQLVLALGDFRDWYNHVRPHQHLGGRTPAEAWAGIDPYAAAPKSASYFSAWDGMLTGYYLRR